MRKITQYGFLAVLMVFGMACAVSADPIEINLGTGTVISGEDTDVPSIEDIILPLMGTSTELYKATPGNPDEGPFAGSYTTTFSGDRESTQIGYDGGPFIGPVAYLLAKDGAAKDGDPNTHAWYLFNLTALGWTGTEQINISGLWPNQGSFSHLSIYGTRTQVPEPSSLLLLGTGIMALGFACRRWIK